MEEKEYLLKGNKTFKQKFYEYLLKIKPHGYYCESFSCGWEERIDENYENNTRQNNTINGRRRRYSHTKRIPIRD